MQKLRLTKKEPYLRFYIVRMPLYSYLLNQILPAIPLRFLGDKVRQNPSKGHIYAMQKLLHKIFQCFLQPEKSRRVEFSKLQNSLFPSASLPPTCHTFQTSTGTEPCSPPPFAVRQRSSRVHMWTENLTSLFFCSTALITSIYPTEGQSYVFPDGSPTEGITY